MFCQCLLDATLTCQPGASPHVIFRKATGEEISREPLTDLSAPELVEFLEKRGLKARKRFVAPPPKDAQVSFEIDGVPYKFYERAVYRSDADAKAKEEGGVLVGFPTRQEHDAIVQKLKEVRNGPRVQDVLRALTNTRRSWSRTARTSTYGRRRGTRTACGFGARAPSKRCARLACCTHLSGAQDGQGQRHSQLARRVPLGLPGAQQPVRPATPHVWVRVFACLTFVRA